MYDYTPPIRDMQFILSELCPLQEITEFPEFEDVSEELLHSILEEAGKFASGVLAPINHSGDIQGCRLENGRVITPDGWQDAYKAFTEAGWLGMSLPCEFGGQGLPKRVSTPVWEMWFSSNLAFTMLPQLNVGQAEALAIAGNDEQKAQWLEKIVTGEWASTMNLTESQAGSDLSTIRSRAEPSDDVHYRLYGQKIFISYGEHELTPNIVHLVLARLPDAPEGVRGLSLFIVPKYLVDEEGSLSVKNDVSCISIEHKLGIHGSPTCTLNFGDKEGAVAYLLGEANQGLKTMFIMMNDARFGVGVQGLGLGERAYQYALNYARERVQGKVAKSEAGNNTIINHPDIKRMIFSMRARNMAMRALLYSAAGWFDLSHHHSDEAMADKYGRYVDLLMPVAKGWCTEVGNDICDDAIQVFGGMGFVEETGVAQFFRDARIITIYEGTTGVQAIDLIGRKILRDRGATLYELIAQMREDCQPLSLDSSEKATVEYYNEMLEDLSTCTDWVVGQPVEDLPKVMVGAVPFLHMLGTVCGAWQLIRLAISAKSKMNKNEGDPVYLRNIIALTHFYMVTYGSQVSAYCCTVKEAGASLLNVDFDQL